MIRLSKLYNTSSKLRMKKKFRYNNLMDIPKINKIVLNFSSKQVLKNEKVLDEVYKNLLNICDQEPIKIKSKKSISNFKLKKKTLIGIKVTLRKKSMYNFLDKVTNIVLPKLKDFTGILNKNLNNVGNLSFSINLILFPEAKCKNSDLILNITIVTSSKDNIEVKFLLNTLNIPFII